MTENTNFKIMGIIIVVAIFGSIFAGVLHKNSVYAEIQNEITAENWSSAKNKLEWLGKYKDSEILLKDVNYHYYINLGDKNFEQKDYKSALGFYKKANENKNNDKSLNEKIKNTKSVIAKLQAEENKKKLELEKKQKLEQQKIQQAKIKERQKQLADIQPAIKRTFYKIDFIEDKSLNARMYDFYVDYYLWVQLPYDVKEGAFKLAVLYAKLKTNEQYSDDDYLFFTKIRNAQTKSVLAEYKGFSGIKINQ